MNKSQNETRIVTAALPFANAIPHIGNLVGSHLPADVFARYCRLLGYKTIFVGGTDEHGTAIEIAAKQAGLTPKELCDKLYKEHKDIYDWLGISYDNFFRTSDELHHKLVKEFFLKLYEHGVIVEKEIELPFCSQCKTVLADRYIKGTCPKCGYDKADGDQCEICGQVLDPKELIKPYCFICQSTNIEFRKTRHLFLSLKKLAPQILNWLENNKNIREQVKQLAKGWIKAGIEDRCITRDLKWGVSVPLKGYEDKVFYVWFDNVIGYISATVNLLGEEGIRLWQDKENTKTYHFLGKDNIPFHTIFWPGQVIAHGDYVLPYNVIGLQYLLFEGKKFSKSKRIGIFADQMISSNILRDYWRFYLTFVIPETKDSDFSLADFKSRVNNDLIKNLGNLINRSVNLVWTDHGGHLPKIQEVDLELEEMINTQVSTVISNYEKCELRAALMEILKLSDIGNKYLQEKKPWESKNASVLTYSLEICRLALLLISPIVIDASKKGLELLNDTGSNLKISRSEKRVNKPYPLFTPLEKIELSN